MDDVLSNYLLKFILLNLTTKALKKIIDIIKVIKYLIIYYKLKLNILTFTPTLYPLLSPIGATSTEDINRI